MALPAGDVRWPGGQVPQDDPDQRQPQLAGVRIPDAKSSVHGGRREIRPAAPPERCGRKLAVAATAMNTRVSLAELAAARIQLRPSEALAIVDEICRCRQSGLVRGIPTAGVVRLSRDGQLSIEGPIDTGDEVARASQ